LEEARAAMERKVAWIEKANNLADLNNELRTIRERLTSLESMALGIFSAMEVRSSLGQPVASDVERHCIGTKEAAKFLGMSPSTLAQMRMRNEGPPAIKMGMRRVLYRVTDLVAWIDARLEPVPHHR
jgi:predicted DNA-binding transcriptional regulator AlpA